MPVFNQHWQHLLFQLRVLYRVFFMRVVDLELLAQDGDTSRLMGQFASVFVTISFFCSFPVPVLLVGRTPIPPHLSYMFQHFLIETSMTIAGIIAVLSCDSAFPDRRDMLVLGPLPVRSSTLFFSKLAAVFAGPIFAMASFNLCTGFSWPMVFAVGAGGSYSLLRSFPAYWLTILLAGSFFVLGILAIQGLAANLLPRQIFLRFSAVLQAALLCILLSSYFLGPSFNSPEALAASQNQHELAWLPAYWFLGLFNQLNGTLRPELVPLAHRAWAALDIVALASVAALLLSYFRTLRRVVEQPEIIPVVRNVSFPFGSSLSAVITLFSLRTLMRSRLHRMILSVYIGIGLTIIFGFIHTRFARQNADASGTLSLTYLLASILIISLSIFALRIVVGIPISLRANWIFRLTQVRPFWHYHRAVRVSFFAICIVPSLVFLSVAVFKRNYSTHAVMAHLALMALLGALIIELCLFAFRKISFACSYMPGKANLHFVFWPTLFGSIQWIRDAASFEGRTLDHPGTFARLFLALAVAGLITHWVANYRAYRVSELIFDEEDMRGMVTLNLR
ncbi:MAG TPA: hypothetical protein VGB69_12275 [Edaphobacter sp.]